MGGMSTIDLHMHSTASDGTTPPQELAAMAVEADLSAIALTDHDTAAGHAACRDGCEHVGVAFIPGIELSCDRGQPRGSMHVLGYFIDPDTPSLQRVIEHLWQARTERAPQIVDRLRELGIDITMEQVIAEAGCAMIGRPHIAAVLLDKGCVGSIREAFERYIGHGAPAYIRKDNLPTAEAIAAIREARGVAVLAHPIQLRYADDDELDRIVGRLRDEGLGGIEVRHSDHDAALVEQYSDLAARYDLVTTGGSDFHGERKDIDLGSQRVPEAWLEPLREAAAATV